MFTSQDSRKVFQKPNILRRKPKTKQGAQIYSESTEAQSDLVHDKDKSFNPESNARANPEYLVLDYETRSSIECMESSQPFEVNKAEESAITAKVFSVATNSEYSKPEDDNITLSDVQSKEKQSSTYELYMIKPCSLFEQQDNYSQDEQGSLNIESFLVDSPNKQRPTVSNDSSNNTAMKSETEVENKWCLNFMSDDSKDMVTPNFYDGSEISKVNTDTNPLIFNETLPTQVPSALEQDIIQSCLTSRVVKYKCDTPNCNKSFWTEARLQKHKVIHSRQKPTNLPTTVECPVKKVDSEGVEHACGIPFPTKEILMKHLNEDHMPEDAAHRCPRCGRRFWWATGMRTHLQSACTAALACSWPGCGRVFRQPCRLREHARAHTGDRPYPCSYPNCNWAFRSASKLVRHARRHTGERRHECAACGRAFPRREHLRDHAARHHARTPRHCTAPGCEQTFANISSLYIHMKKAHRPDSKPPAPKKQRAPKKKSSTDILVMTIDGEAPLIKYDATVPYTPTIDEIETANASAMIIPEEEIVDNDFTIQPEVNEDLGGVNEEFEGVNEGVEGVQGGGSFGYDLEGKCARTHCTWPLQRTQQSEQTFAIEEDTQVGQSECSENNIYTVRSDLFLHGNVLINEDSEFIIRECSNRAVSEVEETSNTGQLDSLDLIDAHPTIDLMQEELMYADAAVDESSFRVFLMNGEELS